MSLTSFLKRSGEMRALLHDNFPCPLAPKPFPLLKAPPLTRNYGVVGQAFDYLLRFYMQRNNPNPMRPHGNQWVADGVRDTPSLLPFLKSAHLYHEHYLEDGNVTDELLESCLNLAILDGVRRAGEMRGILGQADPKDIQDLRNLLTLVPSGPFLDGQRCTLNPAFPFPGGADCDLSIDNQLIEIKTTKFSEVRQEYYQQLLGYYLCSINPERQEQRVERIGIYFSRHGYLWSVKINDIASNDAFLRFLPTWKEMAKHDFADMMERNFVVTDVKVE